MHGLELQAGAAEGREELGLHSQHRTDGSPQPGDARGGPVWRGARSGSKMRRHTSASVVLVQMWKGCAVAPRHGTTTDCHSWIAVPYGDPCSGRITSFVSCWARILPGSDFLSVRNSPMSQPDQPLLPDDCELLSFLSRHLSSDARSESRRSRSFRSKT